jgi:hypothetical protein
MFLINAPMHLCTYRTVSARTRGLKPVSRLRVRVALWKQFMCTLRGTLETIYDRHRCLGTVGSQGRASVRCLRASERRVVERMRTHKRYSMQLVP